MRHGLPIAASATVALLAVAALPDATSTPARAQTGAACNGDKVIRSCGATAQVAGRWLTLRSTDQECSRVDWFRNGQPQTSVFRGGVERVELLGQPGGEIAIGSCKVIETLDSASYDRPVTRPRTITQRGRCIAGRETDKSGNTTRPEQDMGMVTVEASTFEEAVAKIRQICDQRVKGSGG